MSVPFSNTHLRVPRGFGTILEGLAREVLRDQPGDIPKYAAKYFDALLKQRQDSGADPAEWAAKLEDRFYNNHAFKATGAFPEKEFDTKLAIFKEKSYESQTEDESSHSAKIYNLPTIQPNASEEVEVTEGTEEEEEKHNSTEKHIATEKRLPEEESVNRLLDTDEQPDELSDTQEEQDPTTFDQVGRAGNEKDSSFVPDQVIPQSKLEPTDLLSFRSFLNVDVCAQELGTAEDDAGDKEEIAVVDKEIKHSEVEKKTEVTEPGELFSYSGLADVDVFAPELVGTERTMEGATAEDDTHAVEEDRSKPRPEETILLSVLSETEAPEGNQQEDQAETTKEKEGIHNSSGGIHKQLTHIEGGLEGNVIPEVDLLVEVSIEDVPDAQQIKEFRNRLPEEEDSVEVFRTNMIIMQPKEKSKEVAALASDQNISLTQDHDENEMVGVEKEVNSEGEEMESQQEASTMKKKVDANGTNLKNEDDEKGDGIKTTSSSHQPSSKADKENPEYKCEGTGKIQEGKFQQNKSNDPDLKENKTTDTVRGDEEDVNKEGYSEVGDQESNDGGPENHSPQVTQSNSSTAAMEAESETLEANAEYVPEENGESQRTLVESQPEDTGIEKEATSKERTSEAEGLVEEGKIDSENTEEKSDAMFDEGSIIPSHSTDLPPADHQGEERPLGSTKDTAEPEGNSGDEQEDCSRPQEEEDIMDIPLDDPEANRAAAKIQAGFRGHMTRKKMKPEDKAEGEEVSSTGDVLNSSQGAAETGGSGAVERDDTSVPEQ